MKHNKKRNTAIIYETLIKEMTKAILDKDASRKNSIISILKEGFAKGSLLGRELELYRTLTETTNTQPIIAEKILHEAKLEQASLDSQKIFTEQSELITKINKTLGSDIWSNFIANYKSLASINALFNPKTSIKKKVLFEQSIIDNMIAHSTDAADIMKPIDNLTYRSFINKFNEKYGSLLQEQRDLLNNYIASFADDGFELRLYLNEEVGRLKVAIGDVLETSESSPLIKEKTAAVLDYLEELKKRETTERDYHKLLTVQALVKEFQTNA